ncbi:MAG: decaprenyl-phosphate phosphoribosyltransferase [Candidatus Sumerlaeia bacterium]
MASPDNRAPSGNFYRALQILKSMRPHQWSKNVLLFAGVILSYHFHNLYLIGRASAGFGVFCMLAGAIYLLNDLADLENDRLHPRKMRRPLAAGKLRKGEAFLSALFLIIAGHVWAFWLGWAFGFSALAYFITTILYSQFFKHVVILDIILLAFGFVIRAIAGIMVIRVPEGPEIPMTPWFVICIFFLALFIAICKRRHEMMFVKQASDHRRVLGEYSMAMIDQMVAVCTTSSILAYVLYLVSAYKMNDHGEGMRMLVTLPFVIYGIFRYLYLVYRCSEGGEPEMLMLKDKPLLLCALLWLVLLLVLQSWN